MAVAMTVANWFREKRLEPQATHRAATRPTGASATTALPAEPPAHRAARVLYSVLHRILNNTFGLLSIS
eukprot:10066009-Lingulodinium_polyedra.AAC.1